MLNKVHHVTYVVESVSDMAAYLETNFNLTPLRSDEFTERGFRSILYQIGDTLVDFFEPLRDDTPMAEQLRATGPGVSNVARVAAPRIDCSGELMAIPCGTPGELGHVVL